VTAKKSPALYFKDGGFKKRFAIRWRMANGPHPSLPAAGGDTRGRPRTQGDQPIDYGLWTIDYGLSSPLTSPSSYHHADERAEGAVLRGVGGVDPPRVEVQGVAYVATVELLGELGAGAEDLLVAIHL
jgi:hypothetical protein